MSHDMTLEFGVAVKALGEYIETLKQELLFAMAEHKPEKRRMMTQEITTIKRELDKAIQERMKLSQICYHYNNNSVGICSATSA
jgi:hypothetical protein